MYVVSENVCKLSFEKPIPRPTRHHNEGVARAGVDSRDPSSASARFQRAWRNVSTPAGRAEWGLARRAGCAFERRLSRPFLKEAWVARASPQGQARGFVRVAPRRDHNFTNPTVRAMVAAASRPYQGRDRGHRLSPGRPVRWRNSATLAPSTGCARDQAVRSSQLPCALARAHPRCDRDLARARGLVTRDFTWRLPVRLAQARLADPDGGVDRIAVADHHRVLTCAPPRL